MKILLVIDDDFEMASGYDLIVKTKFVGNRLFREVLDYHDSYAGWLGYEGDILVYPKKGYGLTKEDIKMISNGEQIEKLDIIGQDGDACVLATCFNLWDAEVPFNVIWSEVKTPLNKDELLKLYQRQFGSFVVTEQL